MIKFFRKIRYNHMSGNKTGKYLKYAIGEIALIMIGIFLALYLTNLNSEYEKNENFEELVEQIYNGLYTDKGVLSFGIQITQANIANVDLLLGNPDSIPNSSKMFMLFRLNYPLSPLKSQVEHFSGFMDLGAETRSYRELKKEVIVYISYYPWGMINELDKRAYVTPYLHSRDIPSPMNFLFDKLTSEDTFHWTTTDYLIMNELFEKRSLRFALLQEKDRLISSLERLLELKTDAHSLMEKLRIEFPEIRLLFDDIGVVGTAVEGWDQSVPMVLTNPKSSIWELNLYLKEGELKFRNRNSWSQNWGGNSFPEGDLVSGGDNIKVDEGKYHLMVNIEQGVYQFSKIE